MFAGPPPPPFSCEDARKMSAPTLLIVGEKTQLLRRMIMELRSKCLPRASLVEVPGVGHPLVEIMNPKDFNSVVLRFLADH
jgi:pimeloyl-ACP methyl ester carboxylesterase